MCAWLRCNEGGSSEPAPTYPYSLSSLAWSKKSASIAAQYGTDYGYFLGQTPKLPTNARLIYSGTQSQGAAQTNVTYIDISTDGSSWTPIASMATVTNPSTNVSLASYAGQKLYVRLRFYNGGAATHNFAMSSMTITA